LITLPRDETWDGLEPGTVPWLERFWSSEPSMWLALSGGGLRATLFHYGCLKRLRELGLLGKVAAFSSTSGGALAAALLMIDGGPAYSKETRSFNYNWETFEKAVFRIATGGLLDLVGRLLTAYFFYASGLAFLALRLLTDLDLPLAAVAILTGLGLVVHGHLAFHLLGQGAHAPTDIQQEWAELTSYRLPTRAESRRRFLRMLFFPSTLRWQTMNLRAFAARPLQAVHASPRLYMTSVELNSGREIVFSPGVIAPLDASGSRALWEGRSDDREWSTDGVELAQAVAASTALPPFFRPVAISNAHGPMGAFVDGGVVDNLAFNVPASLAAHIHRLRGQRYDPEYAHGVRSFKEDVRYFVILGGHAPVAELQRRSWGRLATFLRLESLFFSHQESSAALAVVDLTRNAGVPGAAVSLKVGFPEGNELHGAGIDPASVRTHLDRFSLAECAVLAYSGYSWIDTHFAPWAAGRPDVPPSARFADILPTHLGFSAPSIESLRHHLRFSGRRSYWHRRLRRLIRFRRVKPQ